MNFRPAHVHLLHSSFVLRLRRHRSRATHKTHSSLGQDYPHDPDHADSSSRSESSPAAGHAGARQRFQGFARSGCRLRSLRAMAALSEARSGRAGAPSQTVKRHGTLRQSIR